MAIVICRLAGFDMDFFEFGWIAIWIIFWDEIVSDDSKFIYDDNLCDV